MRISDWSSDVCSSDLLFACNRAQPCALKADLLYRGGRLVIIDRLAFQERLVENDGERREQVRKYALCGKADGDAANAQDRKSVVYGKSVSVRVDLGGRSSIKKNNIK